MPRKRVLKTGWPPNIETILNAPKLARKPRETDAKYQARLAKMAIAADQKAADQRYQSNIARLKLGSLLILQEPKQRGRKGAWRLKKAQDLGLSPRVLQRILVTSTAFQIGIALPEEILERPFNDLARTIKVWIETGELKSRRKLALLDSLTLQLNRIVERSTRLTPQDRKTFGKSLGAALQKVSAP